MSTDGVTPGVGVGVCTGVGVGTGVVAGVAAGVGAGAGLSTAEVSGVGTGVAVAAFPPQPASRMSARASKTDSIDRFIICLPLNGMIGVSRAFYV